MPTTIADTFRLAADDGHAFTCYRTRPKERAPRVGLVVVQEIFGVNRHIRGVTDRYAEQGFLVLAPALFDRVEAGVELDYSPDGIARGRALRGQVSYAQASEDIAAAALWLAQQKLKVGTVGFCWGGDLAWLSTRLPKVAAAAAFYGGGIGGFAADNPPKVPLQLHFGLEDAHIPAEARNKARAAAPKADYYEYPAGHGFCCEERKDYKAECAETGFGRVLAFFEQHLT